MASQWYDYIVVGAGSAGCALAARLSACQGTRVLLVEAGSPDWHPFIHVPGAVGKLLDSGWCNWNYQSEPQAELNHRRLPIPRGKVLGGSSSLNGMVYIRGHAADYDRWADEGAVGWSYDDVVPYFKRAESHAQRNDAYHGTSGPLRVETGSYRNVLYDAFIEAGRQMGHELTSDFNGKVQEGFGRYDLTIDRGRRANASRAYLRRGVKGKGLSVVTKALVSGLIMSKERVTGVRFRRGSRSCEAYASQEVVLTAGVYNTPKLMMSSGIGPEEALGERGIAVRVRHPEVGRNLQEHLEVGIGYSCTEPITLYSAMNRWGELQAGLQWLFKRNGAAASAHFEAGAFVKTQADAGHPDLQFHFMPLCLSDPTSSTVTEHGFQTIVAPLRPLSRGSVRLKSDDPREPPLIDFGFLSVEKDWRDMRTGVAIAREIFAQPAFDRWRGKEIWPGEGVAGQDGIDGFIRSNAVIAHHACGTCRIGREADAVVDPQCRVYGVEGLRIADTSVMPSLISGNTNAAAIMIAEKAADMILAERSREA